MFMERKERQRIERTDPLHFAEFAAPHDNLQHQEWHHSTTTKRTTPRRRRHHFAALASICYIMLQALFVSTRVSGFSSKRIAGGRFLSAATGKSCQHVVRRGITADENRKDSLRPILRNTASFGVTRCFSSADDTDDEPSRKKPAKKSSKKFKVNDNVTEENMAELAQAFDDMARKEGFDSSMAYYADNASFEDVFDDDEGVFLDDEDDDARLEASVEVNDFDLDPSQFSVKDFVDGDNDGVSGGLQRSGVDEEDDMDARIAAAQSDLFRGGVSVPSKLDNVAFADLERLGFRKETNPFGDDETPRRDQFQLVTDAMTCSACGSDFQCHSQSRPGYLPPDKYEVQVKLGKIQEMQSLDEKAATADWTPEDEVEWLIQTSGNANTEVSDQGVDTETLAEEMGLDLVQLSKKKTICKRCHGLQNFGTVDDALRPGWTEEPLLSQQKFRDLLAPIKEKPAVIIALVDVYDFSGSVLPEIDSIAGDNPVILAANKVDLLPSAMGTQRVENWVRRELEYMGVNSLANVGGAVRLISCKTGAGVGAMLEKARSIADDLDCDIFVCGAANAGKSTLMNHILRKSNKEEKRPMKARAGNANSRKGEVTTSPLPGTTLKFIKGDLGGGLSIYDTPGLLVPGTLTQLLTPEELKIVVPQKQVEPITFRVAAGKCVLIGGLARIELIDECKPFLFTFFVANGIKLHPTDAARADEFILKHAGEILTPPLPPGPERMEEMGALQHHVIDIAGTGWKEAAADIALTGLGWIAVTGAGTARVKVSVPKGVGVSVRPPLMPFDIWDATAKYTGGRAVRKTTKTASGKKRRGVGRN